MWGAFALVYYISKGHLEAVRKLFSLRVEECTSTSGELLQYRCIVFVACWGVALLSIMLPIYISGANMYECGSSFHRSTVAYLYGATELEWLVGVLGCVFTCAVICTLLLLRAKLLRDWKASAAVTVSEAAAANAAHEAAMVALHSAEGSGWSSSSAEHAVLRSKVAHQAPIPSHGLSPQPSSKVADAEAAKFESNAQVQRGRMPYTTKQTALLCVAWGVLCLILSIPSVMYAASKSIPSDNTASIDLGVIEVFAALVRSPPLIQTLALSLTCGPHSKVAEINAIISGVVPGLATSVLTRIGGESDGVKAAVLISVANIMFLIVSPAMTIFYLNIACMGKFIPLWSRCGNEPGSFDLSYGMRVFTELSSYPLVSHESVCAPEYSRGTCSRAIIENLSTLLLSKFIIIVLLGPLVALVLGLPSVVRSAYPWCLPCNRPAVNAGSRLMSWPCSPRPSHPMPQLWLRSTKMWRPLR